MFTFTWHGGGISGKCHLLLSKRPVFTRTVWRDFTFIVVHCVDAIIILGTIFFPPLNKKMLHETSPEFQIFDEDKQWPHRCASERNKWAFGSNYFLQSDTQHRLRFIGSCVNFHLFCVPIYVSPINKNECNRA